MKKEENTIIELTGKDCAIVLRAEGQCEIVLPKIKNEEDEVTEVELLTAGLGLFLRDPNFINLIKGEFIKNINSQTANMTEPKDEK